MKKTFYYTILALTALLALASCDKFLDRQEDERMTEEKIWRSYDNTRKYFLNCMGYLPVDASDCISGVPYFGATDEASMVWNNKYGYAKINFGSWTVEAPPCDRYSTWYSCIRDCNIFLQNPCTDSVLEGDTARQSQYQLMINCVRWARAYSYFLLMRDYGPVFLVGDEIFDPFSTTEELYRERNTWEECVDYVVKEMSACADLLPVTQTAANMGLPTRGAALAVISRLRLYAARPLFNGCALYRTLRNPDSQKNLFPTTPDPEKWVLAAQAAKSVIDMDVYKLYKDEKKPENPYLNYYGVFQENWNDEIIYSAGGYQGRSTIGIHTAPTEGGDGSTPYGGWGPTQTSVDSYAMAAGRYPITGYDRSGGPLVDSRSGYPTADREFDMVPSFVNPFLTALGCSDADATSATPRMYANREPRFYVTVYWPGTGWKHGEGVGHVYFGKGQKGHTTHDYPITGYLVNKWYDHTQDSYQGQWGYITFPTYRYAEIYLNYIESVLECEAAGVSGKDVDHAKAIEYWDELRARSGMPSITSVYPDASIDELIELVHRERQVELAQEGHRYFDTRTWMIAKDVCDGPVYGLDTNVSGTTADTQAPAAMWTRAVMETRVFRSNHYLYPFRQRELDRNKKLTQNYGW